MNKKDLALVQAGRDAILLTHKTWETGWAPIIPGLAALRKEALEAGALKSNAYKDRLNELLEEHEYGEDVLDKDNRAALMNIGMEPDWKRKVASVLKKLTPGQIANIGPRGVWAAIRPREETEHDEKGASEEKAERPLSEKEHLKEQLGDAQDALARSIRLEDPDIEGQINRIMREFPEMRPALFVVYDVLDKHFRELPGSTETRLIQ